MRRNSYRCIFELGRTSVPHLRGFLTSTTVILLMLRYGGVAAGFLTQLFLARLLTPESLGLLFAATSMAAIAATFASFGYPEIVPRYFSRYQVHGRINILNGFVKHCHRDIMFFSSIASSFIVLGALLWPSVSFEERLTFATVALWVPIIAYLEFNSWIALSLRSFFISYIPDGFLKPVIFLTIIASLYFLGFRPGPFVLIVAFSVTSLVLCLGLWLLVRSKLPKTADEDAKPIHSRIIMRWRRDGGLQIPISIYTTLFTDLTIIVLALLLSAPELAAFAIALKIAMLVGFVVQVSHQVMLPSLADANAKHKLGQATATMRAAAALPFAFTTIAIAGAMLFGDRVLSIFHPDFAVAHSVLVLLISIQILRVCFGPVVQLLTITGAQFYNACLCVSSALTLVISSLVFVPGFGITGAAYAIFVSWLFWLTASAVTLNRLTGLRCDILALLVEPRLADRV